MRGRVSAASKPRWRCRITVDDHVIGALMHLILSLEKMLCVNGNKFARFS